MQTRRLSPPAKPMSQIGRNGPSAFSGLVGSSAWSETRGSQVPRSARSSASSPARCAERLVDADDHQLGTEPVELSHRTVMAAGGQTLGPPRCRQCRTRFRVGKDAGGGGPFSRCTLGWI